MVVKKKIRSQKLLTTANSKNVLFWTLQQPFKIKIKQMERSVLEKRAKDVPCRRIFTKLGESAQWRRIQALRMHNSKKFFPVPNFACFTTVCY